MAEAKIDIEPFLENLGILRALADGEKAIEMILLKSPNIQNVLH